MEPKNPKLAKPDNKAAQAVSGGIHVRPREPLQEPPAGEKKEITHRIRMPAKMKLKNLLEQAQLSPFSKLDVDEFIKQIASVKEGKYQPYCDSVPRTFFEILDNAGRVFLFAQVPEDLENMTTTLDKEMMIVRQEAYCLYQSRSM